MFVVLGLLALSVLTQGDYLDPHCGGKQVIVHLFEWTWADVAKECERFLGPWGFCGVQVSPAAEHEVNTNPPAPWWERYQPVSYKLVSRGGNEAQFTDMVQRCNAVGVRIFVDVAINHMTGSERTGTGSGGTPFDGGSLSYPGVPYSAANFNPRSKCPSGDGHVNNYADPHIVRDCYLQSLTDLDQSQDHVRKMIVGFFNHMLDIGVAGFRLDASKHMWPQDLAAIEAATKDTLFGGKPFYIHEVIDQNDGAVKVNEYYDLGKVTEFRYCQKITEGVENFGALQGVVDYGWGMADNDHALIFVNNHDNQRSHGGGGRITTFRKPLELRLASAFTLAWNYGFTRVMSSYEFGDDTEQGPPHYADYTTAEVPIASDGTCEGGWVCEHRWPSIRGMALFRNAVVGTDVGNYYNQGDVVAFSRGDKGFFAMGKRGFDQTFQTGLPAGQYCDLVSNCQQKVTVQQDGTARLHPLTTADPVVAFIAGGPTGPIKEGQAGSFPTSGGNATGTASGTSTDSPQSPEASQGTTTGGSSGHVQPTSGPQTTADDGNTSWKRTVILIERRTNPGEDLFIRGGIGHEHRIGCTQDVTTSPCAIPIRHRADGSGSHYAKVKAWSQGDNFLDWYGAEAGQGRFQGRPAEGTPAVWTTNDPSQPGYNQLNTLGSHYWLVDVDMDCSKTEGGYFEFKSLVGGWEGNLGSASCTGPGSGTPPFTSSNHVARCGFFNVFHFGQSACTIKPL